MGARYRADWTSMDGQQYRVEIHDTDFSGTVTDMEIGMDNFDGFTLAYEGENTGYENTVLTSSCTVNCVVEDSGFETFISDLSGDDEERFFIVIYIYDKGSYVIWWAGVILQDLITMEDDQFPYLFQIEATDGLGRLTEELYPIMDHVESTFLEYLITIISNLPIAQFWGAGEIYLTTIVNWYELDMYTGSPSYSLDPLAVSRVAGVAFMEEDEDTNEMIGLPKMDMLNQIGLRWFATLMLTNGRFYFRQVNEMSKATVNQRDYVKAGTVLGSSSGNDYTVSTFKRMGMWQFLPMYRKISVNYVYNIVPNLLPRQDLYETAVDIGILPGGNSETLIFDGHVRLVMDVGGTGWQDFHRWVFDMKLKVGSYFLTNKNGTLEWSTSGLDRVTLKTRYFNTFMGGYTTTNGFAFISPEIPADGAGEFMFEFMRLEDEDGNTVTPPSGVVSSYTCIDFELILDYDGELESGRTIFEATNEPGGTIVKASSVLELGDIFTGDGPHDYANGKIEVWNGSSWEDSDEEWRDGVSGTPANINTLLVSEVLAAYRKPRRVYSGMIRANGINAMSVIKFGSDAYIMRSGSFNANANEWEGEWFKVGPDKTSIENNSFPKINPEIGRIYKDVGDADGIASLMDLVLKYRDRVYFIGKNSIVTSNYTIGENEHVIYCNPAAGSFNLTLPNYDETKYFAWIIVNVDSTNSVTIKVATGDTIGSTLNGSHVLAANKSITIHNSGIGAVGFSFLGESDRS